MRVRLYNASWKETNGSSAIASTRLQPVVKPAREERSKKILRCSDIPIVIPGLFGEDFNKATPSFWIDLGIAKVSGYGTGNRPSSFERQASKGSGLAMVLSSSNSTTQDGLWPRGGAAGVRCEPPASEGR